MVGSLSATERTVRLTPARRATPGPMTLPYEHSHTPSRTPTSGRRRRRTLRVGMYTESLAGPHLVDIVAAFEANCPGVEVVLVNTGSVRNYLDVLRDGEVDVLADSTSSV